MIAWAHEHPYLPTLIIIAGLTLIFGDRHG